MPYIRAEANTFGTEGLEKLAAIGYVCHSQAYEEGGYEPGSGTNLAKGAGEIMIKEALNIINQMKQSK